MDCFEFWSWGVARYVWCADEVAMVSVPERHAGFPCLRGGFVAGVQVQKFPGVGCAKEFTQTDSFFKDIYLFFEILFLLTSNYLACRLEFLVSGLVSVSLDTDLRWKMNFG
ncbi:hypothetical protein AVEN_173858-1 [Araneus ventricosus]|uniref:Uncharacterized protein n=1 Tax=Araneus ventricosus TaxID=182803 RepID=A0A4Y2I0C5_ARAVE|nr:hypothetical protein AVEN_173858-1 [Araneus ventricosus]